MQNNFEYTDYPALAAHLRSLADEPYRKMQYRIVPGVDKILGVRVPKLRALAKQFAKGDWRVYLSDASAVQDASLEELMLQGLVIGYAKIGQDEALSLIENFVPKIDNWAVCDCCCSSFKTAAKDKEKLLQFLEPYLKSDKEFELRFAVIMLMDYFINDQYIDQIIEIFDGIRHDGYYVKMAVAWALSVCFVKYPEKTMAYLKENNLADWTYNKTLQKIIESFRVDDDTKKVIRSMKRRVK